MLTTIRNNLSRRGLLASGAALTAAGALPASALGMPQEGPETPKLTMYIAGPPQDAEMRKVKQIGIDIVDIPDMPPIPWTAELLRGWMNKMKTQGLSLGIVMTPWFDKTRMEPHWLKIVHGLPGRDVEINKFKDCLQAAGKAGLPVVEYNFFPHRANEGYHEFPRPRRLGDADLRL